jgi:hypothetical protein
MEGFKYAMRGVAKFAKGCAVVTANTTADALELIDNINPSLGILTNGLCRGIVMAIALAYKKGTLAKLDLQRTGRISHWIWIAMLTHDLIGAFACPIYNGLRCLTRPRQGCIVVNNNE